MDESNSDDDSCQGAAMNLLDIRNPSRWDALKSVEESKTDGEISVPKVYQPKFVQVFNKYCETLDKPIDLSNHLMSICLEHLISFSSWARESAARSLWIKTALDDNIDLRPEVRNGLSMILIYCVSAARADQIPDSDMFLVLQETEAGLGIVNKTSLKIYNDPYSYFDFLKSCISGLIDAGKIPENERQNQPKKAKRQNENKEEIYAFEQLKMLLVQLLNQGENALARAKVQQIVTVWHQRHKNIRNHRFATALSAISGNSHISLIPHKFSPFEVETILPVPLAPVPVPVPIIADSSTMDKPSSLSLPPSSKVSTSYGSLEIAARDGRSSPSPKCAKSMLGNSRSPQRTSVPVLRFERIGSSEWAIQESKVFNLEALVLGYHGTFCLVDEVQLGSSTTEGRLKVSSSGIVALPAELQQCGALITSWPKTDHRHMLDFLESWMAQEGDASMLTHWQSQEKSIDNSSSRGVALGYLAYEIVVQVGVVLRANEALGISEDCWRLVYPNDLQDAANSSTLSSLLRIFFPQLRGVEGLGIGDEDVVVKYFAHRLAPPLTHAPALEASSMYQTFGTLADPALAILSRLDANVSFHDIVLQAR